MPGFGTITNVIRKYHMYKKDCLLSFIDCGIRYNKLAFEGPYGECGAVDVFGIWKDNVDEKRSLNYIKQLREHYDFPIFHSPKGMEYHINTFYQSKFGMFTCYEVHFNYGNTRYDTELISYWQRNE